METSEFRAVLLRAYCDCLVGQIDRAAMIVKALRERIEIAESPAVAGDTMLVEGVIALYSGSIETARERLTRAALIGGHLSALDIAPVARGWLALAAYNEGKVLEAADLLRTALCESMAQSVQTPRTRLRLATTAANLAFYADRADVAKVWNLAARRAATAMQLAGVLSSVIFSMAVSSLDACQRKKLSGVLRAEEGQETLMAVQSAVNYDAGFGRGVQPMLHQLALGMAFNICGQYQDARRVLRDYVSAAFGSRIEDAACGFVELAFAELGSSRAGLDADVLSQVVRMGDLLCEPLERAAQFAVLAEHFARVGDDSAHKANLLKKSAALSERESLVSRLRESLAGSELSKPPVGWLQ